MAEEKPKGEPVFLKIPATGETITLPGVTSLSGQDEVKTAANNWLAKNYKGLPVAEPIITRSPITGETQGVTIALSVAPVDTVSLIPTTPPGQVVPATAGAPQLTEEDRAAQSEMQGVYNAGITAGKTPDQILTEIAFVGQRYNRQIDPSYLDLVRKSAAERIPFQFIATPSGETGAVEGLIGEVLKTEPGQMAAGYFGGATNALTAGFALDPATKEYLRETAPVSSFAGELTGGVLASIPAIRGAQIGLAGTRLAGAAPLIGETAYGALYGAGEAGPDNRLLGATYGGLTGLVGGALINRFMPGGPGTFTGAPKTALSPDMATVVEPVAPTPVVPETLVKAKPVELPEAPVATAAIPEAAVAPTPTPELPPAITPERLAEMRTSAEDVLQGMAAGTPEAAPLTGIGSASREKFTLDGPLEAPVAAAAIPEAAIPERIGTMKATNFETPDETKRFLADIAEANKNFPEARRGAMTIEQINDLSKDVDLNQLLGRKVGMPLNAEQIQAAKNVLYQNTDDVVAKAKAWVASGGRDATLLQEATDGLVSNTAFLETLQGASSELGRAMRVLRERPSVDMTLAMKQLLERKADGVPIEDIMQRLATFDDPAKAAEFVSALNKPKFKEKVEEYFVNSLLSGPSTHIYNLSSNLGVVLTTPFEKYAEAGIGAILRTPNRVTVREVNARIAGMLQGAKDGVELAKRAFITEEVQTGKQTVEANRKAIEGRLGRVVRLPNRFLSAQDELFKSMHYRGEIAAQAYTRAAKESAGKTDEFAALYNKYLNDPTDDIKKAAVREAEYRLFQSELGRFGKWVQEGSSKFLPLRILQPFVRTPFNLLKYSAERGPLAPLSDRWRRQIAGTPRERNEALAQLTVGSSILGTASLLAMDGMMTGAGPADPEERAALLATGWQPYSFKFGDTYIPFQRFDPFSTPLGVIADMYTASDYMTDKEINDVGSTLLFSVASNLAEKTYLQGISNFVDSVLSEGRSVDKAKKFLTDTALGFAPNVLRQTSVAIDPTMREATTLVKKAQDRIPYIRGNDIRVMGTDFNIEAVPERLDVWGDPIVRAPSMTVAGKPLIEQFGAATFNLLSPIKPTRETTDPVKKEVARLGLGIDRPKKEVNLSVNIEGEEKPVKFKIELTDRERRQFTLASGIMAKALIQQDIASPEWQQLDDDQRQKLIKDRMSSSREAFRQLIASRAMERYLSENDDLPPIVK
jgi:hypothetical protein